MSGWSKVLSAVHGVARASARRAFAAALTLSLSLLVAPDPAAAQAVRGEASITATGGYGRLVIHMAREVEARARLTGNVLVIEFKQPVDVPVDRLAAGARDYIGAARRDPDGRALRFALARKVRLTTMTAGERLFVDLLPEEWTGEPPGLPREVVEDLARRARTAEQLARQRLKAEQQAKIPPVRVRVANQPTFTRYIFELPELTAVSTDRGKDRLTLSFSATLRFDLADAKLALPEAVTALNAGPPADSTQVRFDFGRQVDVRSFREDTNFVVDVSPIDPKSARSGVPGLPAIAAPPTVAAKVAEPAAESAAPPQSKPPEAAAEVQKPALPEAAKSAEGAPTARRPRDPNQPVSAELRRQGDSLHLFFSFAAPTPASAFVRADALWLVFDTKTAIDVGTLKNDASRTIRDAVVTRVGDAQVLRLKLDRPRLISAEAADNGWEITIGDTAQGVSKPLTIARNMVGPGRTSVTIPFDEPRSAHWLTDPDIGDRMLVVTGLGPARGLLKPQDFVEFRALASAQGIAIQPVADDLKAELSADKVLLARPGGLTLSAGAMAEPRQAPRAVTFDSNAWTADREADFTKREFGLINAAATAPFTLRNMHRLALARFYFAREMYAEAKAVLDAALGDERPTADDPSTLVMHAVANIMLGRADAALKDLSNPVVGNQNDAQLWRALAYARQGQWAQARDAFRDTEGALAALPLQLQRQALRDALRSAVEVGDFTAAANRINDFKTVGVSAELEPALSVLTGRLAQAMGRNQDALTAYRFAAGTGHRPAGAQGRLRELSLRYSRGEISKPDVIAGLETLTTAWRGDETEAEALQMLARLYTEENRYRDMFHAMRVALTAHPAAKVTRDIHDAAAKTFDSLFIAGKADTLPAIDALGLFYDFRELTPVGRRGDEMIRRLAERLVSVDLLDQAADLLQYQVDNRLQGAARAQVATRLAVIDLLNHKPDKAQAVLRATRTADLTDEVRVPRLLIEARALSDMGRHDFALEVIDGIEGREALRLRADIYWAARRWQKAAEHIELLHGDRWQSFEPLDETERSDILRAGVGYALAEDKLGIGRLREKFVAKMAGGPDRRAFDLITGGLGSSSPAFREVARLVASTDTLASFLRELKGRYPEVHSLLPQKPAPGGEPPAPSKPDPRPTGATLRPGAARLSAR
jgi:tetratricopeptide (TPR) repeat protein